VHEALSPIAFPAVSASNPQPVEYLIYQFFLLPRFAIRFNPLLSEFIASPNTEVEYWFLLKPEKSRLSV
jgi:hypothetical protein